MWLVGRLCSHASSVAPYRYAVGFFYTVDKLCIGGFAMIVLSLQRLLSSYSLRMFELLRVVDGVEGSIAGVCFSCYM